MLQNHVEFQAILHLIIIQANHNNVKVFLCLISVLIRKKLLSVPIHWRPLEQACHYISIDSALEHLPVEHPAIVTYIQRGVINPNKSAGFCQPEDIVIHNALILNVGRLVERVLICRHTLIGDDVPGAHEYVDILRMLCRGAEHIDDLVYDDRIALIINNIKDFLSGDTVEFVGHSDVTALRHEILKVAGLCIVTVA